MGFHHKDLDRSNNDLDNIDLLLKEEHKRLHSNLRERDSEGRWIKNDK